MVKNPPVNAGDLAQSLGREDPPEKEMATHCLENPVDRESCRAMVHGVIKVRHDLVTKQQAQLACLYVQLRIRNQGLCTTAGLPGKIEQNDVLLGSSLPFAK